MGRNVRVRQVPRKALERCVTDGTVKGTALAVGKILIEEMAAPRAGIQDSGPMRVWS